MSKSKKVRCPYCSKVDLVDVQKELDDHRQFKVVSNQKIPTPRFIVITCSCKEVYKIDISL